MLPDLIEKLGWMAAPLLICSVATIALILERLLFHSQQGYNTKAVYNRLEKVLERNRNKPKPIRDEIVSYLLEGQKDQVYRSIKWLRLLGTISPLLGLLGTIFGMIQAFQIIAGNTGPVSPNMIADGLWEAMLTTAVGLCIALPALIAAHGFKSLGDGIMQRYTESLNQRSLMYEKIDESDLILH